VTIVFFGTPEFAVPTLRALVDAGHAIPLVVCQPDRPAGRGQRSHEPPIKRHARSIGLEVAQPDQLRAPAFAERIRALEPDAIAVAAYGKILPKALLQTPRLGAINVHGSLLPKYRGAAPIQRAILNGEPATGITIMQMNERMDAGDILAKRETRICSSDTSESLGKRLAEIGAEALVTTLEEIERGTIEPVSQRDEEATLAPMVRKEEGRIDWTREAEDLERTVRAFTPWPSTYTSTSGRLLKVHRAVVRPVESQSAPPGTVVHAEGSDLWIATGHGLLALLEVQLEGKRRLAARDFLAGGGLRAGDRLG
jgi:methionyl-tRNA formyltransferase